ncbi:LLM class flavin-dependent oxidoreductase [Streptomyces sp. TLI_185]|uniref:LLM class flavin-dependent oxidoreductase n=1 Tax=Streptomyces sp. TLI_185 TaxID=2485151 RepID=UPI000F92EA97|nr:LLM class flavin-dependent oxidoreductase [Streptomyces sp. TLI_185]RPF32433.1 luciferase-like monooxygenase [Streptomyces sp. TLI_185]
MRGLLHAPPGEPVVPGRTVRRRLPPPGGPLTVAAFGDRAIATAAAHADRMLLDIVTPEQVRALRAKLLAADEKAGRTPPTLAAWLPAAVDPKAETHTQVLRSVAGYLTVPGYSDVFTAAGFGEAVQPAATGADPVTPVRALPPAEAGAVAWSAISMPYAPASTPMPRPSWTRSPSCRRRPVIRRGSARAGRSGRGVEPERGRGLARVRRRTRSTLGFACRGLPRRRSAPGPQAGLMLWLKRKTLSRS